MAAARQGRCDAVHPGYGFLAESAAFARACEEAGLTFVGPTPGTLDLFGTKTQARALAEANDVPVVPGLSHAVSVEEARAFFADLSEGAGMLIKAVAGGGGRGMRIIAEPGEIDAAFERCASEAEQAFGDPSLYVERWIPRVRHIEVQIAGDARTEPSPTSASATAASSAATRRSSRSPLPPPSPPPFVSVLPLLPCASPG